MPMLETAAQGFQILNKNESEKGSSKHDGERKGRPLTSQRKERHRYREKDRTPKVTTQVSLTDYTISDQNFDAPSEIDILGGMTFWILTVNFFKNGLILVKIFVPRILCQRQFLVEYVLPPN